ncbi:MAG: cobalamin-binding protein [Gemmatimonadales bacterium]|nr:MAG: cobalamin-binding protein [Gemmatimonadales bacterium]
MTPSRVVSLACSNTEILHALGCIHRLVGVDSHSDFPEDALEGLPRLGPDLEIDPELVEALEPDLVLASLTVPGHETVVEAMEARGLPVVVLAPQHLHEIPDNVRLVARLLDVEERGEALALRLEEELVAPSTRDPEPDDPSILVQWWPRPVIAPGRRSWVNGMIRAAGGRNVLAHEDRPSRPLEPEEVAHLAPEAIVVSWCGVHPDQYRPDVVRDNPAFRDVPAIRNDRVVCIPEALMGRPGPRLLQGLDALRDVVGQLRDPRPAPT